MDEESDDKVFRFVEMPRVYVVDVPAVSLFSLRFVKVYIR